MGSCVCACKYDLLTVLWKVPCYCFSVVVAGLLFFFLDYLLGWAGHFETLDITAVVQCAFKPPVIQTDISPKTTEGRMSQKVKHSQKNEFLALLFHNSTLISPPRHISAVTGQILFYVIAPNAPHGRADGKNVKEKSASIPKIKPLSVIFKYSLSPPCITVDCSLIGSAFWTMQLECTL